MAKIKDLEVKQFNLIAADKGFDKRLIAKDYYLTLLLYLMKDADGIHFKGGTALQKTLLNYSRISEDIDFTITKDIQIAKKEIRKLIEPYPFFGKVTQDKDIGIFTRLIVPYKSKIGTGEIFIDLNKKANLLTKPEIVDMSHFYPNIPKFNFKCLSKKEMVAEKVAAAIGRNKPRDHYDIYQVIKNKINIDMTLVRKKCKQSGVEPNITKMFDKAKRLHKRWNEDLNPLIIKETSFQEVMQTLSKHFKLKEGKEEQRKSS